ncbi:PKD domain-containing protein [Microlunatus ginsengisoli]|uniref:PKD domain-containing protein n=1 Tax=Microlunatus ginsengisoli TaxID=363863 RepID=A0ABP6ZIH0_9ACTN
MRRAVATVTAVAATFAASLLSVGLPTASADSAPANPNDPKTPPTVAIDVLPTVQHNGVAWNQLVLGNTVYVVGNFTRARPSGSAAGQNEVVRNNILAYDLTTGALKSFDANLNGQAYGITAAPDGSRIYVGGEFTKVGSTTKNRIVALNPTTGAIITSFNVNAAGTVRAVAATDTTVYLGGTFTAVNGVSRQRLAAVRASDGALLSFAPTMTGTADANPKVNALQLSPTGDRLVVGGNFVTLNGSNRPGYGLGMLNASTGTSLAIQANDVVRNAGKDSAILSLSSDGTNFYGTGYIYGTGGNLEGSFSANWSDARIKWVEDCHGDSYGVYASSTAVYVAGHPHYCLNLGGYNETSPPQRAIAFSKAATGTLTKDTRGYPSFTGQPAPSLQNFFPQMTTGTASGQSQAAWSVSGSGKYVVYAGEFKQVNGTGQQGMVRFATSDIAPNKQGPKLSGTNFTPTVTSPGAGQAKLSWTANYDYDNSNLTYTVLRDNLASPVGTITQASTWWSRPSMTFTDSGLTGGTHSYRVRVVDPFGNSQTSPTVSITVAGGGGGNTPPVASFTTSVNGRTVSANGTGSSDPNGTVTSYAWSWGDGQSGTGSTASHTYAADGTYTIGLTVTDNGGATNSTTRTVTIGTAPAGVANDTFSRTVASGFGSAPTGGAWSTNGSAFSVNGSQGLVTVSTAGQGPWAQLAGVSSSSVDLTAGMVLDKRPNAGAVYAGTIGRRVGSNDYRLKAKVDSAGAVTLYAIRTSGGETALSTLIVPGLTYTPGARLNTRLQVTGTAPTTIRGKVWLSTAAEPSTWQVSATDSTAALQAAGSVGIHTYVSSSATNGPWVFRFDDFVAAQA